VTELEGFYKEHFKYVFLYMKGLTRDDSLAEELTQEAFFKAIKSINEFQEKCDIKVWLCQIAKNTYFTYLRKNHLIDPYEIVNENIQTKVNIEQDLMDKDTMIGIHRILHELEEPYKEVFSLRVFGELTFKQIAEIFCKNENWACVTYHRAKNKIQSKLED